MRIGYGWDSHEFKSGVPLKIGGVELPHSKGLVGHSDGDVLLHAITDALLGAVAAGDIGSYFPPTDPKWKGANSVIFLEEALKQVRLANLPGSKDADMVSIDEVDFHLALWKLLKLQLNLPVIRLVVPSWYLTSILVSQWSAEP